MLDQKVSLQNLDAMGLITTRHCKVCEQAYQAYTKGVYSGMEVPIRSWFCDNCKQYSIQFREGIPETETITSGNYMLVFFVEYKEASIVERSMDDGARKDFRKVKNIPLNELTHEAALLWVEKLKKYVIFQ